MEPNQIHLVASAVSCDFQRFIHALERRFAGQIVRDSLMLIGCNGVHDDVAVVHPVPTTHLYVGARPDANTASDSSAPDSLTKVFGEQHNNAQPFSSIAVCTGFVSIVDALVLTDPCSHCYSARRASPPLPAFLHEPKRPVPAYSRPVPMPRFRVRTRRDERL